MKETKSKADIQKVLESAINSINSAAESAAKAIYSVASEQSKLVNSKAEADHDLLIRLETKMEGLKNDIKDIKDGTTTQIADHEVRLNSLETSKTKQNTTMAIGIGILTLLVSLLIWHLFQA